MSKSSQSTAYSVRIEVDTSKVLRIVDGFEFRFRRAPQKRLRIKSQSVHYTWYFGEVGRNPCTIRGTLGRNSNHFSFFSLVSDKNVAVY